MSVLFCSVADAASIKSIQVKGNIRAEKESILNKVSSKVGAELDPKSIKKDILKIYNIGLFYNVRVYFDDETGVLSFEVKEKPAILEIEVVGSDEIDEKDIKDELTIKRFSVYDQGLVDESIQKVLNLYKKEGLFLAEVKAKTTPMGKNGLKLIINIKEQDNVSINKVFISGNGAYTESELKAQILSREGSAISFITQTGKFAREFLEIDVDRLRQFYLNRGYINFKVESSFSFLTKNRKNLVINFKVSEGDQYRIEKVDLTGDIDPDKETLMKRLDLEDGQVFNLSQVKANIDSLSYHYQDRGYAYA